MIPDSAKASSVVCGCSFSLLESSSCSVGDSVCSIFEGNSSNDSGIVSENDSAFSSIKVGFSKTFSSENAGMTTCSTVPTSSISESCSGLSMYLYKSVSSNLLLGRFSVTTNAPDSLFTVQSSSYQGKAPAKETTSHISPVRKF